MTIAETARRGLRFEDVLLVDSHCHFGHNYAVFTPYNEPDLIAANMDRVGIDHACLCAHEVGSMGDNLLHNQRVAAFVKKYPDRLSGYVTINGNNKDAIYGEFLLCESMGLHLGVKFHIYRQQYDIAGDYLMPVYERLNHRNAVVLHHYFGDLGKTEYLAGNFPHITFILGHPNPQYFPLARKYPNFYMDTCATLAYGFIRDMTDAIGSEKILYGSDFTALDTAFGYGPVVFADIPEEDKRNILGLNMRRILGSVKKP